METENGRPPEPDEPPAIYKTVNQVVAWNLAYFRKAADLKQEELGEMTGRSKRNISADERSWDGGHTREFNAHEIAVLASALGVPVGAFFLPPEDDGTKARYLISVPGGTLDMAGLMAMVMPDNDSDAEAMEAYRNRLTAAVGQYMDPKWGEEAARWRDDLAGPEIRAERAAWLRVQRSGLLGLASALDQMADAIDERKDEG